MRVSAVVRERIRGKVSGLGRRGELDVRLRVSESVARCAKKMQIGVSTVGVVEVSGGERETVCMSQRYVPGWSAESEGSAGTGGHRQRVRVRPARRERSRAAKKKVG